MASYKVSIDPELKDIAAIYIENRRKELPELAALYGAGDLDALRKIGHKLSGSGGSCGFDRLSELGKELETLAQAGELPGVAGCLDAIKDYLENLEIIYE